VEDGESLPQALGRELWEGTGFVVGDRTDLVEVWPMTMPLHELRASGYSGARNHFFWIRTPAFSPFPGVDAVQPGHPADEGILTLGWWTLSEIHAASADGSALFSPRRLGTLFEELLAAEGLPGVTLDLPEKREQSLS